MLKKYLFILFYVNLFAKDIQIPEEIDAFINKHKLSIVNFNYIQQALSDETYQEKKTLFVDIRSSKRHNYDTIPNALSIPSMSFRQNTKNIQKLQNISHSKEIVIFCDIAKCPKSVKIAKQLLEKGFKNVKIYQNGMLDFRSKHYVQSKNLQIKQILLYPKKFTVIDTRNEKEFLKHHIANSINIPLSSNLTITDRIPWDKSTKIIIIGNKTKKSHCFAKKVFENGYKNVGLYIDGFDTWLKIAQEEEKRLVELDKHKSYKSYIGILKKGLDEGTIDTNWFTKNYKKLISKITLVDVREKSERKSGFIMGSKHISLEENNWDDIILKLPKDRYILFYCASGSRSYDIYQFIKNKHPEFTNKMAYLDAKVKCKKLKCLITANEATNPTKW